MSGLEPHEQVLALALAADYVILLFLWILKIEPYVRRRTRTSTFFLLPWAPWKDYRDGRRLVHRYPNVPLSFAVFRWLSYLLGVGVLVLCVLWVIDA